ncbi:hypothetical protein SCOR_12600 [Sulfidibacter corallicola]|uniref:DUF4388 domain-containing protein n=1 Tax=Sulfidibacter corallicola TaxID=2818388 RepID=A0A8A4TGC0_SULCO|nr:hypothetical protein [Sulfidibacter corallicola]QTD47831.1 hypothetical protein J3U87_19765 [Sulfidibacter corallicola]
MADSALQPFENYQLQSVMRDVWERGVTGVVSCEVKGYPKELFVRDGRVLFSTSEDPEDKLPRVLIDQERFTQEQYESVEANFREDISIGRNLVEMGLITQQELVEGAKYQVFRIFSGIVCASTGSFAVKEGDLPEGVVSLPLDFPGDFIRALLELTDRGWISRQFGDDLSFIPQTNPDKPINFEKVKVADFAQQVFGLIDGEMDGNQLAFETDIDDFMLLKFLYALKFLNYIEVEVEAGEEDLEDGDSGNVEGFADELQDALDHSQKVEMLGQASMDETMEMSVFQKTGDSDEKVEPIPGMDPTVEISRASLGTPQPESIFGDDSEEDVDEALNALDDEAELAAFEEDEPAEGEEEPGEVADLQQEEPESAFGGEEETGLDDLGELTSDILEKELEKMAHPMGMDDEAADVPIQRAEEEVEDDTNEEGFEEAEGTDEVDDRAYRRRMLVALVALFLGGLALAYTRGYLDVLLPRTDPVEVDESEDLAMLDASPGDESDPDAADVSESESTDKDPSASEETQPDAKVAHAPESDDSAKPPEPVAEKKVEEPEESAPVVAAKTEAPPELTPEPKPEPVAETTVAEVVKDDPQPPQDREEPAPVAEAPPEKRFFSPVASGWDPKTGKPVPGGAGMADAASALPAGLLDFLLPSLPEPSPHLVEPPPGDEWQALLERGDQKAREMVTPQPASVTKPPVTATVTDASRRKADASSSRKSERNTSGSVAPAGASAATEPPSQPAASPGASSRFAAMAANARTERERQRGKYTLRLYLACQEETVENAMRLAAGNDDLYLLPRDFNGRACYYVCWGVYESRFDALAHRADLPEGIVQTMEEVDVFVVGDLLR